MDRVDIQSNPIGKPIFNIDNRKVTLDGLTVH